MPRGSASRTATGEGTPPLVGCVGITPGPTSLHLISLHQWLVPAPCGEDARLTMDGPLEEMDGPLEGRRSALPSRQRVRRPYGTFSHASDRTRTGQRMRCPYGRSLPMYRTEGRRMRVSSLTASDGRGDACVAPASGALLFASAPQGALIGCLPKKAPIGAREGRMPSLQGPPLLQSRESASGASSCEATANAP